MTRPRRRPPSPLPAIRRRVLAELRRPDDDIPDLGTMTLSPQASARAIEMLNAPRPQWVLEMLRRRSLK